MSIQNTNTTSTNTTLNKYGFIVPEKNGSRPATFTKAAWDKRTYDAYLGFIHVIDGTLTQDKYLRRAKELFNAVGMPADDYHFTLLVLAVAKDTTVTDVGKAHKINAISSFRQFLNGGWIEREGRAVVYTAPRAPEASTASTSKGKKDATKAELEKQVEALKAQLAAALAA